MDEFKNKFNKNDVNLKLAFEISEDEIEIPEKCFMYNYIMKNNIYKKYEKQVCDLLTIIYQSDLFKYLSSALYNTDGKEMKYFFNRKDSIKELRNNIILFVPFYLKGISGFGYREFFKIIIPIYKICYFVSKIENDNFYFRSLCQDYNS